MKRERKWKIKQQKQLLLLQGLMFTLSVVVSTGSTDSTTDLKYFKKFASVVSTYKLSSWHDSLNNTV
jgi:ABC-type uncharacterized transport system involved in gliding motility auxiliary subunit